ncbi:MAG: zf-HC2 domain-containing protein [Phycisphaerales bacterium]
MNENLTCRQLIEFLDDYVADRLAPEVRAAFDAHLAECGPCVHYLSDYRQTIALSRRAMRGGPGAADAPGAIDAEAVAAPEDLVRAVLAARREAR